MDFKAMARANQILKIRVGSHLFGTSTPESDEDYFGVFMPPDETIFGFQKCDEVDLGFVDKDDTGRNTKSAVDFKIHDYRKFIKLVMENNPNFIQSIFVDRKNILEKDEHGFADRLLSLRDRIVHKGAYRKFVAYAHSQQHKMKIKPANYAALELGLGILGNFGNHQVMADVMAGKEKHEPVYGQDSFVDSGKGKHIRCGDLSIERGVFVTKAKKMIRERLSKATSRAVLYTKFGYDCYDQEKTEFLTNRGWRKYEHISDDELLASVDMDTGVLSYEKPLARISKVYSGEMFLVEPYMSKCLVTPGHGMVVSPCRRSAATKNSVEYFPDKSDWKIVPFRDLLDGYRSAYHFRRVPEPREDEYDVRESYLKLAGMFVSEGTVGFRGEGVKDARVTQTTNGNEDFFKSADSIVEEFGLKKYDYAKETVWVMPRRLADQLYDDFGHKKGKTLPDWCMNLSYGQCRVLWDHLRFGDGTETTAGNGEVYYTTNSGLATRIHAALVSSGHVASVRGPYTGDSSFGGTVTMYQVYRPYAQKRIGVLYQKKVRDAGVASSKKGCPVKKHIVDNRLVCCFEVPSGTLVTRYDGRPVVHGNCKFASNLVHLLMSGRELMETGALVFPLAYAQDILDVKQGKYSAEEIDEWSELLLEEARAAYEVTELPAKVSSKIEAFAMREIYEWSQLTTKLKR